MKGYGEKRSWVEISCTVLQAGERAPQVPEDTQRVPLQMRVKGFLVEAASVGDEVEITTKCGRHIRGILSAINPEYDHGFGSPIPELIPIGEEVRAILGKRGRAK